MAMCVIMPTKIIPLLKTLIYAPARRLPNIELTSGYARVLLFMLIRRELGGTGTGCLFQFTYCVYNTK